MKIAKITGAGKSDKEVNYSFTDTKPATGNNYYLLNQVDFDGAIKSYTDLVQNVNFGLSSNNIYASLTNNKLSLKIISNANAAGNIKLYDLNGKLAVNKKILLSKGINQLEEGLNLPTGVYMLNIDVDGHSKSFKLLKD